MSDKYFGEIDRLREVIQSLQQENTKLREALEACVDSWGDYAPHPNSKAKRVLNDAKQALATGGE